MFSCWAPSTSYGRRAEPQAPAEPGGDATEHAVVGGATEAPAGEGVTDVVHVDPLRVEAQRPAVSAGAPSRESQRRTSGPVPETPRRPGRPLCQGSTMTQIRAARCSHDPGTGHRGRADQVSSCRDRPACGRRRTAPARETRVLRGGRAGADDARMCSAPEPRLARLGGPRLRSDVHVCSRSCARPELRAPDRTGHVDLLSALRGRSSLGRRRARSGDRHSASVTTGLVRRGADGLAPALTCDDVCARQDSNLQPLDP